MGARMMMDDHENLGKNPPLLAQTSSDAASLDDSVNSTRPCVHNGSDKDDSLNDSLEDAEEFLRRHIDKVQAEVVESQVLKHRPRSAETALIRFVTTYAAAHSSPAQFLRRLKKALHDLEAKLPTKE